MPIEAFGAALLRGMGWKEGEALGTGKFKGYAVMLGMMCIYICSINFNRNMLKIYVHEYKCTYTHIAYM